MHYYISMLWILLITLQPIAATEQSNNDNSSDDKNCKITKYGVNCPLDIDLKDLIKNHYDKLFAEQKFTFQKDGKIWEVSVAEVDPRLDIKAIDDSKLSYYFNHRSDWCIVDFIMEKNIECKGGTILIDPQKILTLNFTQQGIVSAIHESLFNHNISTLS